MSNIQIKERMFYGVDSTVAELFVTAGLAEHIVPAPKPPAPTFPEWSVIQGAIEGTFAIRYVNAANGHTYTFTGDVAQAKNGFKARQWVGGVDGEEGHYAFVGPEPPAEVISNLAALRGEAATENQNASRHNEVVRNSPHNKK